VRPQLHHHLRRRVEPEGARGQGPSRSLCGPLRIRSSPHRGTHRQVACQDRPHAISRSRRPSLHRFDAALPGPVWLGLGPLERRQEGMVVLVFTVGRPAREVGLSTLHYFGRRHHQLDGPPRTS